MLFGRDKQNLVSAADSLQDRPTALMVGEHAVFGRALAGSDGRLAVPEGYDCILFGMGCFWGAERVFWQAGDAPVPGVGAIATPQLTAAGYAGGYTANPTYRDVCSGKTAHTEVVAVVYDEAVTPLAALLSIFWNRHDPTQGMRQGNDLGTQYRSAIYYYSDAQEAVINASRDQVAARLQAAGHSPITTEIRRDQVFYFAEDEHQQYLHKNPAGYCGLKGLGQPLFEPS